MVVLVVFYMLLILAFVWCASWEQGVQLWGGSGREVNRGQERGWEQGRWEAGFLDKTDKGRGGEERSIAGLECEEWSERGLLPWEEEWIDGAKMPFRVEEDQNSEGCEFVWVD